MHEIASGDGALGAYGVRSSVTISEGELSWPPSTWVRNQAPSILGDAEEDLAECIAVWQESASKDGDSHRAAVGINHASPVASIPSLAGLDGLGPLVSVNVGGNVYRTTAGTLRKVPFFDSLLRHAGDGAIGTTLDEQGHYFVDRSGEFFGYVLEYIRCGHWLLHDRADDPVFVNALRAEAEFYGLDPVRDRLPVATITEYVTVWQFRDDTSMYVDCLEQTIREDPFHQGLFRLCKYSGGLPLDQQTCTRRFKATTHCPQSAIAYFAMRGFRLQHIIQGVMISHTTSADGQTKAGSGVQYMLSRPMPPNSLAPT